MLMKQIILAAGLAVALVSPVSAQVIGGDINMNVDRDDDLRVFAGDIDITGRIGGSLRAVGGDINIDAAVGEDVHLGGGSVRMSGTVGGDLKIAGGELDVDAAVNGDADLAGGFVHVNGPIGGSLHAAAGVVELDTEFTAGNDVEAVGEQIILRGSIAGSADMTADEITIEGRIDGDLETYARYVRVTPGAVITGQIIHRGPNEPDVGEGAIVTGGIDFTRESYVDEFDFDGFEGLDLDFDFVPAGPVIGAFFVGFYFLFFLLAAALMPNGVARMVTEFRQRPVVSPLIGFVTWAFWPIILAVGIILLALTIVGVLLVPFWILAVFMILSLSYPFGAAAIGDLVFNRRRDGQLRFGMRILTTLGVLIAAAALWVVPPIGLVGWFVLTWIGLGAWLFALGGGRDRQPAAIESPAV
ncbi:MAG: hypothetical protein CMF74_04780 [Maricaulis sp.]|jgi:cytoskeletal protein CcmA (bactofilin family)|nr:hypothetical protein [Maricaulis sp.]HAQ33919.1 hypothetical protein [Alphaproteobacteria bacterium]